METYILGDSWLEVVDLELQRHQKHLAELKWNVHEAQERMKSYVDPKRKHKESRPGIGSGWN